MSFLEQVAKYINMHHGNDLGELCCVFPNRRSGLFFQQQLRQIVKKTSWAPKILTIGELMQELSAISVADPIDLLFEIYDVYSSKSDKPENLDAFQPWAEMMLGDFDTLDKYLVDPHSIFQNIRDLKEIDQKFGALEPEQIEFIRQFWKDFGIGKESEEKTIFLHTWNILPLVYDGLQEKLQAKKEGYEGMLYREVAGLASDELHERLTSGHYCFIGLNALSKSEKRLLSLMRNSGRASFFWDYDEEYLLNESMEAGMFVRQNIVEFPAPAAFEMHSSLKSEKNISIYDLPSDVLQAKTVHQILSERTEGIREATDTAVIACDENLLMPVLTAVPAAIKELNITMGYPFANTSLNAFIESILNLHKNERHSKSGTISYYHKDVSSLVNHQYYTLLNGEEGAVMEKILGENRVYLGADFFEGSFDRTLFMPVSGVGELCLKLDRILEQILEAFADETDSMKPKLELEYVMLLSARLTRLSESCAGRSDLEIPTFVRLFRRILHGLKIPFQGEPLAGLQLMGILETRLLDFRHVIMLSVNEDVMPGSGSGNSFIPYTLRFAYGLPTREDMDAIYAYYFYRVIQRAERVDLMFKSASEGVNSGEMSRYLYQMKYDYGAEIIRPQLPVVSIEKSPIIIEKSPAIMEILEKYLAGDDEDREYLSPSALNTYLDCPLKFYFRKIARVSEQDEILEELDQIGIGNILHKTIQRLYEKTGEDGVIKEEDLKVLRKDPLLEEVLKEEFAREHFGSPVLRGLEGRNLIIFEIIKKYVLMIIDYDAANSPLHLLGLESKYYSEVEIEQGEEKKQIRIGGQFDRIDQTDGGLVRIIDYKSGNPKHDFKSLDSLFDPEDSARSKEAFQAFMYAAIYLDNHPEKKVQPGLYVVRKLKNKDFNPFFQEKLSRNSSIPLLSFNDSAEEFQSMLKDLLSEIYNSEIPIRQTDNIQHCRICDFKAVCQKD